MRAIVLIVIGVNLLFPGTAKAISPEDFDKLPCRVRTDYLAGLVDGAIRGLEGHGKTEDAKRLGILFQDQTGSGFVAQFESNLAVVKDLNRDEASKSSGKFYQVEHAVSLTAKDNGIALPVSFVLTINKEFKPRPEDDLSALKEPIWPPAVSQDDKDSYHHLMLTVEKNERSYDDQLCRCRERLLHIEGNLKSAEKQSIVLSDGRHAYRTKGGTIVDEKGIPLSGEQLKAAQRGGVELIEYEKVKELRDQELEQRTLIGRIQAAKADDAKTLKEEGPRHFLK